MENLFEDIEATILWISLLGPGFLILFGRSRFLTGRMINVTQSAFEYLMVSSIYYSAAYPIFRSLTEPNYISLFVFLFGAPFLFGAAIGVSTQKQYFRKVLNLLRLNPIHTCPTGWDYMFNNRKGYSWVVVSLTSGKKYYGAFGPQSLASSDIQARDIYIENIYDKDFQPIEKDGRKRGVWISEAEIAAIEIVEDHKT